MHGSEYAGSALPSEDTRSCGLRVNWPRQAILTIYLLFGYASILSAMVLVLAYLHFIAPSKQTESADHLTRPQVAEPSIAEAPSQSSTSNDTVPVPNSDIGVEMRSAMSAEEPSVGTTYIQSADEIKADHNTPQTWPDHAIMSKRENWFGIFRRAEFVTFFFSEVAGKGSKESKVVMLTNYNLPQTIYGRDDVFLSQAFVIEIDCENLEGRPVQRFINSAHYLSGKDLSDSDIPFPKTQKKFDPSDPMYRFACSASMQQRR